MPDDLKANDSLKKYTSVADLAKGYVHANAMIGADKVVIPKDDAPAEEWNKFYEKLGRPGKPEEYSLISEEELKKSGVLDPDAVKKFTAKFHELGLTKGQAQKLFMEYHDFTKQQIESAEAKMADINKSGEDALRKEWGAAFDQRATVVKRMMEKYFTAETRQGLEDLGLGNHPGLIKDLYTLASQFSEDTAYGKARADYAMTPDQAKEEIVKLQRDPTFMKAYTTALDPTHTEAVEKMRKLVQWSLGS